MTYSRTDLMAIPPSTQNTDWTFLGALYGIFATIVAVCFKWIDSSFAAKKAQNEVFIKTVVNEAMTSALRDVNNKVDTLFEYREKDRENLDKKFEGIMRELRK